MRVAVLFSGGKDSMYSLYLASKGHDIVCLINVNSRNKESYMFQTKGQELIESQAKCLGIPLERCSNSGVKEEEVEHLQSFISKLVTKYKIEGIVTGAIKSSYQALRIERICSNLDLWCFNPLWQINEKQYLLELLENKFKVIIVSIAAYPLDKKYLGVELDFNLSEKLNVLHDKNMINSAGEGGEYETVVLDMPLFKYKIDLKKTNKIIESENSGDLVMEEFNLILK